MSRITVVHLPKTQDLAQLREQGRNMKALRLLSLQESPGSFLSRYEDEVGQPEEFWLERLRFEKAHHFVIIEERLTPAAFSDSQWIAFLVLIDMSSRRDAESDQDEESTEFLRYHMASVYVRPDWRGRGLCTRLIQNAVDWIAAEARASDQSKTYLETSVRKANTADILYASLGFAHWKDEIVKARDGSELECRTMRLEIVS